MPHLSKRILEPEVKKDILNSFSNVIKDLDSYRDVEMFLNSVLSDTERLMIAKRIVAAFLLKQKVESEKIQQSLKLTQATVLRLNLWIQTHPDGFEVLFEKLEKEKRFNFTKILLRKLLKYAVTASLGKTPNPFKPKFETDHP